MSPELIGVLGIVTLLGLLAIGTPIGVGLGLVGTGGLALLLGAEPAVIKLGVVSFETISKYELGVLPLFLLMAHLCFAAGASRDFFSAAAAFLGHRRGGLALASIGGCAGFGAISGSSLATVATVSSVALPEMRRAGYHPGFATGALAAGGTLGSLVPPSGALIVFGIIAEQSIGKLFAASIIPGASQALFYMATIAMLCLWRPELGPRAQRLPWRERLPALRRIADVALLILFVIGGLMVGWFTPTEAASVGVGRGTATVGVSWRSDQRQARRSAGRDTPHDGHDLCRHHRRDPVRDLHQRQRSHRGICRSSSLMRMPARRWRSASWRWCCCSSARFSTVWR